MIKKLFTKQKIPKPIFLEINLILMETMQIKVKLKNRFLKKIIKIKQLLVIKMKIQKIFKSKIKVKIKKEGIIFQKNIKINLIL